ncbi:phosphatases II [Delitschia confertaspora ATCC 74209]|uniref:Phosphatases II n=1 Tax=Delitschia confertaspora ATCC 74209 TaxID=1513339 RepID=A0A9P4JFR2_9PLEO|nr:phosphatases II [Delitschia confertaspora ATCC 74209]
MVPTQAEAALSDMITTHASHHEYTYRLPSPPRIIVPPPTLAQELPQIELADAKNGGVDRTFLTGISLQDVIHNNTMLEWSYELRRKAQMILPMLYLGPMVSAKDVDFITREGITMVLGVRPKAPSMNGVVKSAQNLGIESAMIDAPTYWELVSHLSHAVCLIDRHLELVHNLSAAAGTPQTGKVLVFCESGNEKSAAVAAAYLMNILHDCDHIKAMQVVLAQRFCVNFDDTLKDLLRSYWDIVSATRSVAGSAAATPQTPAKGLTMSNHFQSPSSSARKRTMGEILADEDVDVEMGMDGRCEVESWDHLRFQGRDNSPFR